MSGAHTGFTPESDDLYAGDFRHSGSYPALDSVLDCHGGNRTAATCTEQTYPDDAIRLVEINELDVPSIDMEGRADGIQRHLDPLDDGRLIGRLD